MFPVYTCLLMRRISISSDGVSADASKCGVGRRCDRGGVPLTLDAAWSTAQTDAFFAQNDIEADRVAEFDWLDNGFLIETGPGLASLELANRLAGQQGVELSSPNWSVEAELK